MCRRVNLEVVAIIIMGLGPVIICIILLVLSVSRAPFCSSAF